MISEKVHIANVRSLTRRPKSFVKFAVGVGTCGRAGPTGKSSNELCRTFGSRLKKKTSFGPFFRRPGHSHQMAYGIIWQFGKTSRIATGPYLKN
jgi:hypothetical protein